MYLSDFQGKCYNLQLMRFILAILVIFSHSFPLANGNQSKEWLMIATHGQMSFGDLAVSFFFMFAGFYATSSVNRWEKVFLYERLRRYIPALMVVVCSCIVLGALFTNYSLFEYFSNYLTWRYLLNGIMILQHNLPGVFNNNIYGTTVNGALWTLPVELVCDVGVFFAYKLKWLSQKRIGFTIPAFVLLELVMLYFANQYYVIKSCVHATVMFYVGIMYRIFGEYIQLSRQIAMTSVIGIIGMVFIIRNAWLGVMLFGSYLLFYVLFRREQLSHKVDLLGQCSYSIYLWGFPIQQAVTDLFGGCMNSFINFAISVPIAVVFGVGTFSFLNGRIRGNI